MLERLKQLTASFWQAVRHHKLPLETESAWFVLVSALDFFMTYILLHRGEDEEVHFIESNPIAAFFLNHWGVNGLLFFKLFVVTLVVLICQVVARRNLVLARRVLFLGTAIVTAVVVYSVLLHQSAPPAGTSIENDVTAPQGASQQPDY